MFVGAQHAANRHSERSLRSEESLFGPERALQLPLHHTKERASSSRPLFDFTVLLAN